MKQLIRFLLIGALAFTACKDDKDDTPGTPASENTKLLAKSWVLADAIIGGATFYGTLDSCEKDDITIFKLGGDFERNEGPLKCMVDAPQIISRGRWFFNADETQVQIVLDQSPDTSTWDIVSLTPTEFKASFWQTELVELTYRLE